MKLVIAILLFSAWAQAKTQEIFTLTYGLKQQQVAVLKAVKVKNKTAYVKSVLDNQSQIKTTRLSAAQYKKIKNDFVLVEKSISQFSVSNENCQEQVIIQSWQKEPLQVCLDKAPIKERQKVTDYIKKNYSF